MTSSSSSSSSSTFMIKKCIGIIVATTAVVACIALFTSSSSSSSSSSSDNDEKQLGVVGSLKRKLYMQRIRPDLPLTVIMLDGYDDDYYDDDQYWSPNHGGHYFNKDDDYTYSYTPVDNEYITPTKGGYGGRQGRSLSEIRFNKVPPIVDGYNTNAWRYAPSRDYVMGVHSSVFPLMSSDYPLTAGSDKVKTLVRETMADSVILPGDYQLHGGKPASYWLQHTYNTPVYPGDPLFWDELRHVVEVQIARRNGDSPSNLNYWPATWEAHTSLTDVADAVKGEYPGFHQQTIIGQMFKDGIEMHRDMSPFRSVVDFVGTEVRMASINMWSIEAVAAIDFMLKWNVGMPRPEEVVWLIANDAFTTETDNVPADIVTLIKSMNLQHAAEFTAYEDGCPMHPSYPAMHSAASTCSFWIPAICKLTADQYCEALRVDYATAYARTVAGVHYQMDNIAGLNIGQRIVREHFPSMMEEKYGYEANMIRTKMDALSFDWNKFDSDACTIDGVSASDFLEKAYSAGYDEE